MKGKARLSNRILLFVSIAIILAIFLIMYLTISLVSSYHNDMIKEEVKNGVSVLSEKVEVFKESSAGFALLAAKDRLILESVMDSNTGKLESAAKSILESTKTDFVIFTDKNGRMLGSAGQKISTVNLKSNPVVENALNGIITSSVESALTAHFSALTAAPVNSEDGSVEGAIVVGYLLDNQSIVDEIKRQVQTDVTIFQGNTRVNTTIEKDGVRQVGTQLSEAVTKTVINEGKDYDGAADILGSQYLCSYRPLKNHNNEIVGVLFSGKSVEAVSVLVRKIAVYAFAIAVFAVLAIIVVLVLYLKKVLTAPLKKVVHAAEEISDGVLDIHLDVKTNNEIGMLSSAFEKMADRLHSLISQVSDSSDKIALASKEIASSSLSLSEGSAEQVAIVQELSSSSMEIMTMTQNNADNSKNASHLSEKAKDKCKEGNEKMKELLGAMDGINTSSKKISKIIKVIDDIAFQTNILALNAAVEAAQAGQYGKGFAVVAENVKQLAQKSAKAAKEIAEMIEESVASSNNGTASANETASILSDIFESINEVNAMIAEISKASTEQSAGIAQINSAIERISGILQSYSSMAEESSASIAKLSEQAELMKQQVALFKLKDR